MFKTYFHDVLQKSIVITFSGLLREGEADLLRLTTRFSLESPYPKPFADHL